MCTNMAETRGHYCSIEPRALTSHKTSMEQLWNFQWDWKKVCPVNEMQRWVELITHCHRATDRYISLENAHSKLFLNNSDRSLKLMSHFMFFPPHRSDHAPFVWTAGTDTTKDPMCEHSDTITSLFIALFHQKTHTHTCTEAQHGTLVHPSQTDVHSSLRATPIRGFF